MSTRKIATSNREIGPINSLPGRRILALMALVVLTVGSTAPGSPLADAAMRQDEATVRSLLADGADVNVAQGDGMTALHWAARNGAGELVDLLLGAKADVAAVTRIGLQTPLHLAGEMGHEWPVRSLLKAGADPAALTATGATALHLAAEAGAEEGVAALLDGGAPVDARDAVRGNTPLMFAAAAGRADAVRLLLSRGADGDATSRVVDIAARAAIDLEARQVRDEMYARFRREAPESEWSEWRPTPEQVASVMEAARATQERLEKEHSERGRDEDGRLEDIPDGPRSMAQLVSQQGGLTALLYAAREGHEETVVALLEGGVNIDLQSGGDETSPLLMSLINGHFDLSMSLIDAGADPTLASDIGVTPLFQVIHTRYSPKSRYPQQEAYKQQQTSHYEIMERLLRAGVDPNTRLTRNLWYSEFNFGQLGVDFWGMTPFFRAAHALDVEAMKILVAAGADPTIPTRAPPKRSRGFGPSAEDYSGLPPVEVGGPGVYPIHAVSGVGYGAGTISGADGSGWAANSHMHVPNGWLLAATYLVEELGADVNQRDHNGFSPIHWAAGRGDNELIRFYLAHGGDPLVVSRWGITTVDIANGPEEKLRPYYDTIELLMALGAINNDRCVIC